MNVVAESLGAVHTHTHTHTHTGTLLNKCKGLLSRASFIHENNKLNRYSKEAGLCL